MSGKVETIHLAVESYLIRRIGFSCSETDSSIKSPWFGPGLQNDGSDRAGLKFQSYKVPTDH